MQDKIPILVGLIAIIRGMIELWGGFFGRKRARGDLAHIILPTPEDVTKYGGRRSSFS